MTRKINPRRFSGGWNGPRAEGSLGFIKFTGLVWLGDIGILGLPSPRAQKAEAMPMCHDTRGGNLDQDCWGF